MSRLIKIAPDTYYHIYNRGVHKKDIFHNDIDRARFMFLLLSLQSPIVLRNYNRLIKDFLESFDLVKIIGDDLVKEIIDGKYIEVVSFCLMPNHFHLLIKQKKENGVSKYMQRLLTAYTKYYNIRYDKSGHLFQGPYKIVQIDTDEQLMHTSAYIHRNPLEIGQSFNNLDKYTWSSYQDYVNNNRWEGFIERSIILERFSNKGNDSYKNFVKTSPAKMEFE